MIFFPEGCRGDIPQTRVTTLTIVENLNVFPGNAANLLI
ncbi:hypothetical protein SbBS512_E0557 [Shigella boydii CDC 3083-94]|uniref:Uncharacterized protein n=1 Tax=Shigella boydii serotype 18 (strain CDC 3083-94 / BS512) TaxID=344609 RepID=B2TU37_SHIB3|nr:hypothetical protein SbBS512_E0557 [Shigella boydii CDC 3083-94]